MQKIHLKLKELLNTHNVRTYIFEETSTFTTIEMVSPNDFIRVICVPTANCRINDVCAGARIPEKMKKTKNELIHWNINFRFNWKTLRDFGIWESQSLLWNSRSTTNDEHPITYVIDERMKGSVQMNETFSNFYWMGCRAFETLRSLLSHFRHFCPFLQLDSYTN